MENSQNSELAEALHGLGFPSAKFERIFTVKIGGRQAKRKPDVSIVNGSIHIVSGKYGARNELRSVTTAQEYKEDLEPEIRHAGVSLGEVFAVTYPASTGEKYILHVLPRPGRRELSLRLDTLEETAQKVASVIKGELAPVASAQEPVTEEARRLFSWGAEALAETLKGKNLDDIEEIFGGHDFFKSLLLPRLKGEKRANALRLGAAYLFVNQVLFYVLLSNAAREAGYPFDKQYPPIDADHFASPPVLRSDYFERVHSRNYEPVYGFDVAQFFKGANAALACKDIVRGIIALAPKLDVPDLVGQIFQTLIPFEIRKPLGANYTNPRAAKLLARLAVVSSDDTVMDPACGSGTLLVASYRRKLDLAREGDSPERLHRRFLERDITGIEAMGFSAHLSAVNLALQRPLVETEHVRIGLADSTTKRPPDPALRREAGEVSTMITPTESIVAREFVQTTLGTDSRARGRRSRPTSRVVRVSRKEPLPINLEKVDLVIMNPPFTSWDNMGEAYREAVKKSFTREQGQPAGFREAAYWKTSQQTFFLLLADLFLKPGGTVAAVLPITTLTGQAFAPLMDYLLKHYTIQTIVVGLGRSSFSEDTSLSECLLVAKKAPPAPDSSFVLLGTETPPDAWTDRDIGRICDSVAEGAAADGLSRLRIARQESLRLDQETLSGLVFRLHPEYEAAQGRLKEVFDQNAERLIRFGDLGISMHRWVLGGGWLKHYGSRGLFVFQDEKRATKDADRLVLDSRSNAGAVVHDRIGGGSFALPSSHLKPAIRTFAYAPGIDLTGRAELVVTRPSGPLREILVAEYGKREGEIYFNRITRGLRRAGGGRWEALIHAGFGKLAFAGRLNLASKGARVLCVRTGEPSLLAAYGFFATTPIADRTEKLLSLWMNSTPFLLELLDKLTITEGTWVRMEQYILFPSLVLNPKELGEEEWLRIEKLYDKLLKESFPPLVDQLRSGAVRDYIDDTMLDVLGIDDAETRRDLATTMRKGALTGLVALQRGMGGGDDRSDVGNVADDSDEDESSEPGAG